MTGEGRLWLQDALVARGLARVYSLPDNRACTQELLVREDEARGKRLELWSSSAYRIVDARDLERLDRLIHSYQLIEGTVLNVGKGSGRVYLNFAQDWRSDFTISFRARSDGARGQARARAGWLDWRGGPTIEATHPEQIELLPGVGGGQGEAKPPQDRRPIPL